MYEADFFFISTVCNTQRRKKKIATYPESCRTRDLNVEFQRFNSGKHSDCKETNIAQLFTCKGEKIVNAGYLENIADFCENYNLY